MGHKKFMKKIDNLLYILTIYITGYLTIQVDLRS